MTKKESFAKLLLYKPDNPVERAFKDEMIRFFNTYEDCFERSLSIGHFTASCWLLDKTGTKALLTHHAKLNRWLQLGGHCNGNPDTLAVAIKEAQEESGILAIEPMSTEIFDIDIHLIPARKGEAEHYHYDIRYLLQVTSDEEIVVSEESHALQWIDTQSMHSLELSDSVMRMFKKWHN